MLPLRSHSLSLSLKAPAVQALCLQFLSFFIIVFGATILWKTIGWVLPILLLAILQGLVAALLSRRCDLASWWLLIQLLFAPALVIVLGWQLPPWIFLLAFLLMLSLYWSTYRTQVPLYLSGPRVWKAVSELLPARPLRGIDIGSGLGGLVLNLAKRHPESEFYGIELAPLPWLLSLLRARLRSNPAHFLRGDYQLLDLSRFDVVFAYLSPVAMSPLWLKFQAEMPVGSLLISYEFAIEGQTADEMYQPIKDGPYLYVWRKQ
ncbi:class I SAM-dependent methyltransferase [Actimicrobium sp. CCI2.3]|uniref:class I SAM-dependent methyltransferase n=1 Tax=Actimicrobium sp. CCI2.3 TaxID=3048616 RepID=UPI002AB55EFC|nr:class I SAM-dependent methyltransferase [Actimicrobium sp. CCI2.3]MDY7575360.1 class I SAM-dependent methyltransferase [Actimicrobium sp. CCI2.3]MEB0021272.1 class I SAM-dependent methyltransferase [Actimicrobium sp. CCI2.3]